MPGIPMAGQAYGTCPERWLSRHSYARILMPGIPMSFDAVCGLCCPIGGFALLRMPESKEIGNTLRSKYKLSGDF
jgi:hypothetical protein